MKKNPYITFYTLLMGFLCPIIQGAEEKNEGKDEEKIEPTETIESLMDSFLQMIEQEPLASHFTGNEIEQDSAKFDSHTFTKTQLSSLEKKLILDRAYEVSSLPLNATVPHLGQPQPLENEIILSDLGQAPSSSISDQSDLQIYKKILEDRLAVIRKIKDDGVVHIIIKNDIQHYIRRIPILLTILNKEAYNLITLPNLFGIYVILNRISKEDVDFDSPTIDTLSAVCQKVLTKSLQHPKNSDKITNCSHFIDVILNFLTHEKYGQQFQNHAPFKAMCQSQTKKITTNKKLLFSLFHTKRNNAMELLNAYVAPLGDNVEWACSFLNERLKTLLPNAEPATLYQLFGQVRLFKDCFCPFCPSSLSRHCVTRMLPEIKALFGEMAKCYEEKNQNDLTTRLLFFEKVFCPFSALAASDQRLRKSQLLSLYALGDKIDLFNQQVCFDLLLNPMYNCCKKKNFAENQKFIGQEVQKVFLLGQPIHFNALQEVNLPPLYKIIAFLNLWPWLALKWKKKVLQQPYPIDIIINQKDYHVVETAQPRLLPLEKVEAFYLQALTALSFQQTIHQVHEKIKHKKNPKEVGKAFEKAEKAILSAPFSGTYEELLYMDLLFHGFLKVRNHQFPKKLGLILKSYLGAMHPPTPFIRYLIRFRYAEYMQLCAKYFNEGTPKIQSLSLKKLMQVDGKNYMTYAPTPYEIETLAHLGLTVFSKAIASKKWSIVLQAWDSFSSLENNRLTFFPICILELPPQKEASKQLLIAIYHKWYDFVTKGYIKKTKHYPPPNYLEIGLHLFRTHIDIFKKLDVKVHESAILIFSNMMSSPGASWIIHTMQAFSPIFNHLPEEIVKNASGMLLRKLQKIFDSDQFTKKDKEEILDLVKLYNLDEEAFCEHFFQVLPTTKEKNILYIYTLLSEFLARSSSDYFFFSELLINHAGRKKFLADTFTHEAEIQNLPCGTLVMPFRDQVATLKE